MIGLVLDRILGHRCHVCGERVRDLVRHYVPCAERGESS